MNQRLIRTTSLVSVAAFGLTGCANMDPGAAAALVGGLAGATTGIIARQAGASTTEAALLGAAVGIAAGAIAYNYQKRRATEQELAIARMRAAEYQRRVSSGSKPQPKSRYIAVPTTPTKVTPASAPGAPAKVSSPPASTVVLFDTKTNSVVGNNVYEMSEKPKKGEVVKFDTVSAEYVGA